MALVTDNLRVFITEGREWVWDGAWEMDEVTYDMHK